jgi:hypothetical protein
MTRTAGTRTAGASTMRALVALVLLGGGLGGCLGGGSGSGVGATRPAVMPLLSELPTDPNKRDAVLDQSATAAGPEQRQGMTRKERKAETAAATAAAILGGIFSKTSSVTLGTATVIDATDLIAPQPAPRVKRPSPRTRDAARPEDAGTPDDASKPDEPPADDPGPSNADLIPWIKLK